MIASQKNQPVAWHAAFLKMLPAIERHAHICFRKFDPEAREEAVQETICNALAAYRRVRL